MYCVNTSRYTCCSKNKFLPVIIYSTSYYWFTDLCKKNKNIIKVQHLKINTATLTHVQFNVIQYRKHAPVPLVVIWCALYPHIRPIPNEHNKHFLCLVILWCRRLHNSERCLQYSVPHIRDIRNIFQCNAVQYSITINYGLKNDHRVISAPLCHSVTLSIINCTKLSDHWV